MYGTVFVLCPYEKMFAIAKDSFTLPAINLQKSAR